MNDLFFHIHYCNGGRQKEPQKLTTVISRTLQHHELVFACAGQGNFWVGGKKFPVRRGMLLYIPAFVPYHIQLDPKIPPGFLTVHFSFAGVTLNDGKWNVSESIEALPFHYAQELKDAYPIEEQFRKLVDSWEAKLPGYEFSTRTMLAQLLIEIKQSLNKQPENFAASLKVEKIIQYMCEHIDHKCNLAELAGVVQISSYYLSKIFKEKTGYSVIEYFNKIKIDRAKMMLIEGNKKVKDVAHALGFSDEFYFSRIFKKTEGISPSEYHNKNVHGI